jgi:hypothetical protein
MQKVGKEKRYFPGCCGMRTKVTAVSVLPPVPLIPELPQIPPIAKDVVNEISEILKRLHDILTRINVLIGKLNQLLELLERLPLDRIIQVLQRDDLNLLEKCREITRILGQSGQDLGEALKILGRVLAKGNDIYRELMEAQEQFEELWNKINGLVAKFGG